MENASKALMMAGGVLIGILVISLAVYLFADFGATSSSVIAEKTRQQIVQFNTKFTTYENYKDKNGNWAITIYDIITVAKFAKENNIYYGATNSNDYNYVSVFVNGKDLAKYDEEGYRALIEDDQNSITGNANNGTNSELPKYKVDNISYNNEGRVNSIRFSSVN